MAKVINKIARILLASAYVILGYYNLTAMVSLLTLARGTFDTVCIIITEIVWGALLFFGGVIIYSITFSKKKKLWR